MKRSLLRQALKISRDTLKTHPEYSHYMHWSFLIQKNSLIDFDTNDAGEAPIFYGYRKRVNWSNAKRHSEFNVFRKGRGLLIPNKTFEIINVRLNKQGQIKNSAPCSCCVNLLTSLFLCSCVYFTTDEGIWAKTIF